MKIIKILFILVVVYLLVITNSVDSSSKKEKSATKSKKIQNKSKNLIENGMITKKPENKSVKIEKSKNDFQTYIWNRFGKRRADCSIIKQI
jgi:hypothetical protein